MLSEATLDFGRRVAAGLLGVDALYREEPDSGDGFVVLNMDRGGSLVPERFGGWREAREYFHGARAEVDSLPERDRTAYYGGLCRSTLSFIRWREHGLNFGSRVRDFLQVPARPVAERVLDAMRDALRSLLHGLGHHGDLERQCAHWEARHRVPPEDAHAVLGRLLDRAWDHTEDRLLRIPASKVDGMRVAPVTGVAYNARCDYHARTIELNVDPALTEPGLKHLAVHEGYPGHYVQFRLRESMVAEGAAAADVLLSVVNTASSSVFEGIADAGTKMVDWIEDDDDRVQALLNRYRAGVVTAAAWRLHAQGWTEQRVTDWLRAHTLVGGEGWVMNRMRFIAAPSRAVLIWSYWWGEPLVLAAWERVPPSRRHDFLTFLYGRLHSPASVGMFAQAG